MRKIQQTVLKMILLVLVYEELYEVHWAKIVVSHSGQQDPKCC